MLRKTITFFKPKFVLIFHKDFLKELTFSTNGIGKEILPVETWAKKEKKDVASPELWENR